MTANRISLVTGATGKQGGAVARSLLRRAQKVRVFTRDPAKAEVLKQLGAEVVVGSSTDRSSLDAALKGVDQVFLMTTFFENGLEAEVQQGVAVADAAKASGVEHLVFASVGSAHRNTSIPHFETKWRVEQHIKQIGLPATILRPAAFMENFGTYWPPNAQGVLILPFRPTTKLHMIAVKDIGEFAAAAFMRPAEFIGQAIDLAGDALTLPEIAAHLSGAMGRPVTFQPLPEDQVEAAMGHDFARMFRWFNEVGYGVDVPALEKRWGIPLSKFVDVVAEAPWAKPA